MPDTGNEEEIIYVDRLQEVVDRLDKELEIEEIFKPSSLLKRLSNAVNNTTNISRLNRLRSQFILRPLPDSKTAEVLLEKPKVK